MTFGQLASCESPVARSERLTPVLFCLTRGVHLTRFPPRSVYILLGGYPPFFDESRKRLFAKIKAGKFEFHPAYWDETSAEAKDLISKMLTVNPAKRLSAAELLHHPWLHKPEDMLSAKSLTGTLSELKRFNARRQFKVAVDAVLATVRINEMMHGGSAPADAAVSSA